MCSGSFSRFGVGVEGNLGNRLCAASSAGEKRGSDQQKAVQMSVFMQFSYFFGRAAADAA